MKALRGVFGATALGIGTFFATAWLITRVVIPSYEDPSNRTYTSRFGYPALLRARSEAFPVTTARAEERTLTAHFLGEGLMCSEPVQVPVVPMGRVARVYVKEGDYVYRGQLIAEIDSELADLKIASAKTAIEAAKTQLERTRLGSLNVMPRERPELDQISLEVAKQEVEMANRIIHLYDGLVQKGALPMEPLLKSKQTLAKALGDMRTAEENLKMSRPGKPLSIRAAELSLEGSKLALTRLLVEKKDYKIYAVADGVVQQALIHEGEYEHGEGSPAFTLAVGKWFGAYLDQTAIGRFGEGTSVSVRLEAFPGRTFSGRVEKIIPIVSYSPGGPEASRPVRPLGTGSPEWPATFTARVVFDDQQNEVVPGLTGFAEVKVERHGLAVPRSSLTSVSGGKGIAYVVDGSDRFRPQQVVTGVEADGWIEILSGLQAGTEVLSSGHEVLRPGDRIAISNAAESSEKQVAASGGRSSESRSSQSGLPPAEVTPASFTPEGLR